MFAQIEKTFEVKLPLATLFEAPTIEELARILRRDAPPAGWSPLVAIQPSGSRPPFSASMELAEPFSSIANSQGAWAPTSRFTDCKRSAWTRVAHR